VIGAFVLGAVALGASAVVVWGSGRFFRHTVTFVSYFRGSVNGLNIGAPVKFRGVQIGSVTEIRSRLAQAATIKPEEFPIPVWFDIDEKQVSDIGGGVPLDRSHIDQLISQGLRSQLQLESFVTGVLYLGLDFLPESPAILVQAARPDILEVPSVPTALERASEALTKFMTQIQNVDIDAAVHSITVAADGVNGLVRSAEVHRAVVAAGEALESIRRLSDAAQPMVKGFQDTSVGARDSLHRLDAALGDLQTLIDSEGPLSVELTRTIVDLGEAARNVRDLAGYLERNPDALLVGRPGS
jgi:paraquat-inducible protein B